MKFRKTKKSPYWQADLRAEGFGRISTGYQNIRDAKNYVIDFLSKRQAVPFQIVGSLPDLIRKYLKYSELNKTKSVYFQDRDTLRKFQEILKVSSITEINPSFIEVWKLKRLETVKPATVNRNLNTISNMFMKAVEWGFVGTSPIKGMKRLRTPKALPKFYSEQEIEAILTASSPEHRPMWILFLNTGMRRGEVARMRWDWIKDGTIRIRDNKERREKVIPISGELERALKEIPRTSEWVFRSRDPYWYTRQFRKTAKDAKVGGTLHWLRHSVATHLLLRGVPIQVVSKLLGHASLRATQIYSHAIDEHLKSAVGKLKFGKLD